MVALSQRFTRRTPTALALLAAALAGTFPACARPVPTRTSQAEPVLLLPADTITAEAVGGREIQKRPRESLPTLLQGRTPGVEVAVHTDGSFSVRIRGAASFLASTEPLYVIDGVPVTPGPGGALSGISPYDIESIEVLKNPAETAVYGMRGANGVIVITTRRPTD